MIEPSARNRPGKAFACRSRSESDLLKASLPLVPSESVSINFEKIAPARGCMGANAQAALRGADLELVPFVVARTGTYRNRIRDEC